MSVGDGRERADFIPDMACLSRVCAEKRCSWVGMGRCEIGGVNAELIGWRERSRVRRVDGTMAVGLMV